MKEPLSLDVGSPDEVAGVLLAAADTYSASAVELSAAWQSPQASKVWEKIAEELERAAFRIRRIAADA